jgi:hypothetical protein
MNTRAPTISTMGMRNFLPKTYSSDFYLFLFPPKEHVIDFNLDSLISSVSVAEVRGPFHSSQSGLGVLAGRLD